MSRIFTINSRDNKIALKISVNVLFNVYFELIVLELQCNFFHIEYFFFPLSAATIPEVGPRMAARHFITVNILPS